MTKKYLYCKKCKKYPDEIWEEYKGKVIEDRQWDGDCYELLDSNIGLLDVISHCSECDEILQEKQS